MTCYDHSMTGKLVNKKLQTTKKQLQTPHWLKAARERWSTVHKGHVYCAPWPLRCCKYHQEGQTSLVAIFVAIARCFQGTNAYLSVLRGVLRHSTINNTWILWDGHHLLVYSYVSTKVSHVALTDSLNPAGGEWGERGVWFVPTRVLCKEIVGFYPTLLWYS